MSRFRGCGAGSIYLAVLCLVVLMGCGRAGMPVPDPQPTLDGSCTGPVSLVASTGQETPVMRSQAVKLTLHVGDTLHIVAPGRCGSSVRANDTTRLVGLTSDDAQTLTALRPGSMRLTLLHAACDGSPQASQCAGGVVPLGDVALTVTPR